MLQKYKKRKKEQRKIKTKIEDWKMKNIVCEQAQEAVYTPRREMERTPPPRLIIIHKVQLIQKQQIENESKTPSP